MRVYPKGCRYYVVANGQVYPLKITRQRAIIEGIMPTFTYDDRSAAVVVQPRGKKKWWLFEPGEYFNSIKFITTAPDPDPLIMRALLS